MSKPATIRDVASAAGVSIAVVSRVLNDGSGPVAPATRDRVREAMERLSYQPRTAARELRYAPMTTLGLVLADVTNPFFARLADQVVWEARARGIQVLLMTTQEDPRLEEEALHTLAARRVGGVVATPASIDATAWRELTDVSTRVVFVDRFLPDLPSADVVSIDNAHSARTATEHLLDLGHTRIGFVSGPLASTTGRARTDSHVAALERRGLQVDATLLRNVPFRGDQGADAVGSLLALRQPPTAVIIANTAQVVSGMRRLRQLGVRIPDDLSVVVFDDDPWTELFSPALTIVRQPTSLLATHSVDLALRPPAADGGRIIRVEAEFVIRSSTAALR